MEPPSAPESLPATAESQRLLSLELLIGLLAAAAALVLLSWLGEEVLEGEALRLR